ncbi:hypothetical protein BLNAU_13446 [Blattamonas nauphoetae]|uniref:Uncharacterized protein n=1 Tax=Blattamonas nauphoetae TaxID=2049346 RepID=A0ABQ9XGG7_9EUKA|nr:hypothetical protein BLNAU_23604 [Blattamonas nauphoetae]KAK2951562.1 hypothetical protein BLNAU_13446 [Blattamonas nauphoetae]
MESSLATMRSSQPLQYDLSVLHHLLRFCVALCRLYPQTRPSLSVFILSSIVSQSVFLIHTIQRPAARTASRWSSPSSTSPLPSPRSRRLSSLTIPFSPDLLRGRRHNHQSLLSQSAASSLPCLFQSRSQRLTVSSCRLARSSHSSPPTRCSLSRSSLARSSLKARSATTTAPPR